MALAKKGGVKWEIVTIVPLAVVAFFLFSHIISINAFAKDKADVETCRLSVVASSVDVAFGEHAWGVEWFKVTAPNPFYIDCGKRESFISKDSIRSAGGDTKLSPKNDVREKQLKDFILGEMSSCWRSFGDVSGKIYTAGVGEHESISVDDSACFYCSEVFIDKKFFIDDESKKTTAVTLHDFYTYANEKSRIIDGKSYVEYLTHGSKLDSVPKKDLVLDSSHLQWSTVFMIKKTDNKLWVPAIDTITSGIIDAVTREIKAGFLPKPDSGIVGCYMVAEDEKGNVAVVEHKDSAVGCDNKDFNGIVFGKVGVGYDKRTFLSFERLPFTRDTARFPMTVRFVPTEEVFRDGQCKKLY